MQDVSGKEGSLEGMVCEALDHQSGCTCMHDFTELDAADDVDLNSLLYAVLNGGVAGSESQGF